jgi:hypothetical protein
MNPWMVLLVWLRLRRYEAKILVAKTVKIIEEIGNLLQKP